MTSQENQAKLLTIFLGEFEDHLATIESETLRLRSLAEEERGAALPALFRAVHSLKGAARTVGVDAVAKICHDLEDLLEDIRNSRRRMTEEIFGHLLEVSHVLKESRNAVAQGRPPRGGKAVDATVPPTSQIAPQPQSLIRLPVNELDAMLNLASDLVVQANRLAQRATNSALDDDLRRLALHMGRLNRELRRARMQPLSTVMTPLHRAVSDFCARNPDCSVELHLQGTTIEVDRDVLERLAGILLQLVLNAAVHGIEPRQEREAAGKNGPGRIDVIAELDGDRLEIIVADDGAGIDVERIAARASTLGLPCPSSDDDALQLIFAPGMTTATEVTAESGRGVGLDIVRTGLVEIGGFLDLRSTPKEGTRFILTLPITLASLDAVRVLADRRSFAIPSRFIERMIQIDQTQTIDVDGVACLPTPEGPVALIHLNDVLGLPRPPIQSQRRRVILLKAGYQRAALVVEEWLSVDTLLVKSLGSRLKKSRYFTGSAIDDDGNLELIINVGELFRLLEFPENSSSRNLGGAEPRRLLVVDDSITTRTFYDDLLRRAGFSVVLAADGHQAWRELNRRSFDAVVTDIEMPGLNGFELTKKIRHDSSLSHLPVVLITARADDADRRRGVQCGADAYLVKNTLSITEIATILNGLFLE